MTETYTTIESGPKPGHEESNSLFIGYPKWYKLDPKTMISDNFIQDPFIDALQWDYFCQHFYEWVRL